MTGAWSGALTFLLGLIVGLIANYFSPPFKSLMDGLFGTVSYVINPDRFDLTGSWLYEFEEPHRVSPNGKRNETEHVKLRHIGAVVSGEGWTEVEKRRFQ